MFIGHYGVSLAAKRWAPNVSLGWLFLAVQGLDLLFCTFVLLGVEKMAIVPGFTAYNPYDLFFMPYTHGLLGALVWSVIAGLLARALIGRKGALAAFVVGACVFSHWILDVPMHTADMPLAGNQSTKIGFGLWRHRELSLAAELVAFWAGALFWLRTTGGLGRRRVTTLVFLAVLTAVLLSTPFSPPPSSPAAFAVTALVAYAVLAGFAAWVERRRATESTRTRTAR
jgi:membrane-bound metal-dependent hydrolase YbcI (DUF457 family)